MHFAESTTSLVLTSTGKTRKKHNRWFGTPEKGLSSETRVLSPEHSANPISRAYFHWVQHIISLGFSKKIELGDVWLISASRTSETLSSDLRTNLKKSTTLFKALLLTLKHDFVFGGCAQLLASIILVVNPFLLRFIIHAIEDDRNSYFRQQPVRKIGTGIGVLMCIWVLQLLQSLCNNQALYRGNLCGIQAKAALSALIFEKSMSIRGRRKLGTLRRKPPPNEEKGNLWNSLQQILTKDQKKSTTSPKAENVLDGDDAIIKMVMTDLQTLQGASAQCHLAWTTPVSIIFGTAFLVVNVRQAALVGLAVFAIGHPLMTRMTTRMKGAQGNVKKIIGERIGLIREMLTLVRAIKLFAWSNFFITRFNELRKREIAAIQNGTIRRIAIFTITITLPGIACMLTFITCSLANLQFDAADVFSTLALFNALRAPLTLLPRVSSDIAEARAVIERVENFLNSSYEESTTTEVKDAEDVMELEKANFIWEKPLEQNANGKPNSGGRSSRGHSRRFSIASVSHGMETVYARFSNVSLPSWRDSIHSQYSNFMHPRRPESPSPYSRDASHPYGRRTNPSVAGSIDTAYTAQSFYPVPPLPAWQAHSPRSSVSSPKKNRESMYSQYSTVSLPRGMQTGHSRQSSYPIPPVPKLHHHSSGLGASMSPNRETVYSQHSVASIPDWIPGIESPQERRSIYAPSAWKARGHSPQSSVSISRGREGATSRASHGSIPKEPESNPAQIGTTEQERFKAIQKLESPAQPAQPAQPTLFKLSDVDLRCKANDFIGIVGPVGSGKSSLLAGLAGEMKLTDGDFRVRGTRAYCSQTAWMQNATVRQNILFGAPFDHGWYNQVVGACALQQDFDALPNGDETEVGERGATISGGQRQRMSLARAIYRQADIIFLDDPLSALDATVGRMVLQDAICGLLRNKCRMLATHHLWALEQCTQIWYLENERVIKYDSLQSLAQAQPDFTRRSERATKERPSSTQKAPKDTAAAGKKPPAGKNMQFLMAKEDIATRVTWATILRFADSSHHALFVWPAMIVLWLLAQASVIAPNIWLSEWLQHRLPWATSAYVGLYIGLVASQIAFNMFFGVILAVGVTQASEATLKRAVKRILQAPVTFFDTNPQGRILARLTKDSAIIDWTLAVTLRIFLTTLGGLTAACVIIIVYEHYFVAALVPLACAIAVVVWYQQKSAPSIQGLEASLGNTMSAQFTEALTGASTIKSYGVEGVFLAKVHAAIDDMDSVSIIKFATQRWTGVRVDLLGSLLVLVVGLSSILSYRTLPEATAGLCLSMSLTSTQTLTFLIRQYTDVVTALGAITRLDQYTQNEIEESSTANTVALPEIPEHGGAEIKIKDLNMRYRAGLPRVLSGITMTIPAGYHVGIVGRTGAGKSSIINALARLNNYDGRISVDGQDITSFSLDDWRKQLTVIPQQPVLFKGTVRSNLDPSQKHSDIDMWYSIRQAGLVDEPDDYASDDGTSHGKTKPAAIDLDTEILVDGSNLSLGQRQLLALARAILHAGRVVICDEATSGLDQVTDRKVQETVKRHFNDKTVLYIAHRIRSVLGYDLVCVMDSGRVVEYGPPLLLWENGGSFRELCNKAGIVREEI